MTSKIPFTPQDIPDLQKAKDLFSTLVHTIAGLRDPKKGCPWDLEQNHKTLSRFMIEEAYEASAVMNEGTWTEDLCDELGDVLLQVVLNAQIAMQDKRFDICDVIASITDKMIRRHPHVFGDESERAQNSLSEIKANWSAIKAKEKKDPTDLTPQHIFQTEKVHKIAPASLQAYRIGKLAKQINFDFKDTDEVIENFFSEVEEFKQAYKNQEGKERVADEISDLYFSLAQVCRHLSLDPENTAMQGNQKFLRRFQKMFDLTTKRGVDFSSLTREHQENLWKEAKL